MLSTTLWLFCLLNAPGILVHGYFTTNNYYISTVPSLNCYPLFVMFHVLWMMHFQIIILKDFFRCFFVLFWGGFFRYLHIFMSISWVFSPFQLFLHLTLRPLHFLRKHAVDLGDCPINQYDNMLYNILKHCSRQF